MRATACPDTSGRTPLLYCTTCAPTSPGSRARIRRASARRSCARGLNPWLNPPPASRCRQPPSPRVLREAMAAFLCVGRPPTARATSHAACQPCMCEWPARDPTPQWQCAVRSGEWASPSRSRQWRSAASIELRGSRGSSASGRARGSASVPAPPATAKYSDFLARHASISLRDQRKVHVGHPHIMEAADISRPVRGATGEGGERGR